MLFRSRRDEPVDAFDGVRLWLPHDDAGRETAALCSVDADVADVLQRAASEPVLRGIGDGVPWSAVGGGSADGEEWRRAAEGVGVGDWDGKEVACEVGRKAVDTLCFFLTS